MNSKFKVGDSIIVKQGVKEPDLEEFELGGWQGRVTEIDIESNKENILITVEWDSLTLKQIPSGYIEQSEIDGYDWSSMVLYDSNLENATPRDSQKQVIKTQEKLSDKYQWISLGEEGLRISKILQGVDPNDEMKCLQKWVEHLDKSLTFPVEAIVSESADDWSFNIGDIVIIKSLPHIVDMYGIIASIKFGREKYESPLCDLEVIDKNSANFQSIKDYAIWFANR